MPKKKEIEVEEPEDWKLGSPIVDEASRVAVEKRMTTAAARKPVVPKLSTVPAYAQGEYHAKVAEMLKLAEEKYGHKPTPEEIVAIKKAVHDGREPELPAPIPSKEEQMKTRTAELLEQHTRRDLEAIARDLGFEPTKTEHPNMEALAKAIVEKEFEEK